MRHEVLAPAGSPEICRAVIGAGADAVYLGGEKYGARAFARNFSEHEILSALDFAHLYGHRIYLTVNTLLKNRETGAELYEYLKPFYEHGLDAIIVQDFGVFQFVRKWFPDLPVHASTQMSVSNVYGASFLLRQGASRIVTARELSLPEIRRIREQTGAEIESFVHGALCYCYSGQCLMSSLIGGRSGNRGRCAQPCRLSYQVQGKTGACFHKNEKYPLSLKDLCVIDRIPQLCEAGIYSFKIEGRMKSLEYAAGVTAVYRKYLDLYEEPQAEFRVDEDDYRYLEALGNRSGFTRGYYEMRNGRQMMTLTGSSHTSGDAKEAYRPVTAKKISVGGRITVRQGEPLTLTVQRLPDGRNNAEPCTVTVRGETVPAALKQPLSGSDVREQICKTGNTPFIFETFAVDLAESCFVRVKQLNELRRSALCLLEQNILKAYRRPEPEPYEAVILNRPASDQDPFLNVQVSVTEQIEETLRHPFVDMISLDFHYPFNRKGKPEMSGVSEWAGEHDWFRELDRARRRIVSAGKQAAFCFPHVFRENSSALFESEAVRDLIRSFDTVWVRSYDSLGFCLQTLRLNPDRISLDYPLYICSEQAYAAFSGCAADAREADPAESGFDFRQYTASPELNNKELSHMPNGCAQFCLYGYVPVMVSAQCVYENYRRCSKAGDNGTALHLSDRYGREFSVIRDCVHCYNILYNSVPTYLFHQAEAVKKLNFASYRISFVSENRAQVRKILEDYRLSFPAGEAVSPPGRDNYTNGHFRRGVE